MIGRALLALATVAVIGLGFWYTAGPEYLSLLP